MAHIIAEWQTEADDEEIFSETYPEDRSIGTIAEALEMLYGPLKYIRIELETTEE